MEKIIITRPLSRWEIGYSDIKTALYTFLTLFCIAGSYVGYSSLEAQPSGWILTVLIGLFLVCITSFFLAYKSFELSLDVMHVLEPLWENDSRRAFELFAQELAGSHVSFLKMMLFLLSGKKFSARDLPVINIRYHDRFRARALALARRQPPEIQEERVAAIEKFFQDWENDLPQNQKSEKNRQAAQKQEAGNGTSDSL